MRRGDVYRIVAKVREVLQENRRRTERGERAGPSGKTREREGREEQLLTVILYLRMSKHQGQQSRGVWGLGGEKKRAIGAVLMHFKHTVKEVVHRVEDFALDFSPAKASSRIRSHRSLCTQNLPFFVHSYNDPQGLRSREHHNNLRQAA